MHHSNLSKIYNIPIKKTKRCTFTLTPLDKRSPVEHIQLLILALNHLFVIKYLPQSQANKTDQQATLHIVS